MIITIDIGNTNITLGAFDKDELVKTWRLSSINRTIDEYGVLFYNLFTFSKINHFDIQGVCISCVVPPILPTIEKAINNYFSAKIVILGPGTKTGIPILYENPKEVGADRIANAVGGYERLKKSLIIVDFGTATTFDCISEKGEYLGGVIAPGIEIAAEALFTKTSKLPKIEIQDPQKIIGRNTINSIQAGIFYGYIGLVDGIVKRIKEEMASNPVVLATGGLSELFSKKCDSINIIDPYITLYGLKLIYEKNA